MVRSVVSRVRVPLLRTTTLRRNDAGTGNTRRCETTVTAPTQEAMDMKNALPADQIPGPRPIPVLGTLYKYLPGGGYDFYRPISTGLKMYKKYGPIVHEQLGATHRIRIFNAKDSEAIIRTEGRLPVRPAMDIFVKVAEDMGVPTNMVAARGEEWHRQRSAVQKDMMQPKTVAQYMQAQEQVALDLVEYLKKKRDEKQEVRDIVLSFQRYATEAIAVVVYEKRLGAFEITEENKETNVAFQVMTTADTLFNLLLPLMNTWSLVKKGFFQKKYQTFLTASKDMNNMSKMLIKEAEAAGKVTQDTILGKLMLNENVTYEEAVNIMDALLEAGVESTAFTLAHNIYHLAKHPEKQEKLYEELSRELPNGQPVSYEILSHKLKYLRATVKEVNRLSPAASASVFRELKQDTLLSGYRVPAGWSVSVDNATMGRLPQYFDNPEEFRPERWLTEDRAFHKQTAFVVLPFGHGARSCLGRRFAEQEIYLALIKLVQNFRMEYHYGDLGLKASTFTGLDGPLHVTLIDRN